MPLISIILPVYNAEGTLNEAIRSIHRQTWEDWELVLVDDGSMDESPYIAQDWAQRDDRIQVLHRPHEGLVKALNAGLDVSRGTYIARMDADDISLPRRLERQAELLKSDADPGVVSCLVKHGGEEVDESGYARYVAWINSLTEPGEIATNRFVESPVAHPSVMFRRKLLDEFGGYRDGPFPEDYELWLRWLDRGVCMTKVQEKLFWWRDLPGRLSRNHPRYDVRAFYAVKTEYLTRWLERHNPRHPKVTVWGAGRITRKRAEMLTDHGIEITHYIDVDPNKVGNTIHGRPVLSHNELPEPGRQFILSYLAGHGLRTKVQKWLEERGYVMGRDFLLAA